MEPDRLEPHAGREIEAVGQLVQQLVANARRRPLRPGLEVRADVGVEVGDGCPADAAGEAGGGAVGLFRGYASAGDADRPDGGDRGCIGQQGVAVEALGIRGGGESEEHGGEGAHGAAEWRVGRFRVKSDTVDVKRTR